MDGSVIAVVLFLGFPAIAIGIVWAGHLGHKGAAQYVVGVLLSLLVVVGLAAVLCAVAFAGCAVLAITHQ
jgi:hypothetical protein